MLRKNSFLLRYKSKIIVCSLLLILILATVYFLRGRFNNKKNFGVVNAAEREAVEVVSGDISNSITGSGTIKSSSTKTITSEVSADVLNINVKVGDKVSKGDVLIELDKSDYETKIRDLNKNINNISSNVNSYKEDVENLYIYADKSGYVSNLNLELGDTVNKNSTLFQVTNDEYYYIECQVNYTNNLKIQVGNLAKIRLVDSLTYLDGEVSYVSDLKERADSGVALQTVEIRIKNPGYTLDGLEVSIVVNTDNGSIKAVQNTVIKSEDSKSFKAQSSGTIKSLNIRNGDYINTGDLIMVLENKDLEKNLSDTRSNLNDAYEDLKNEKSNLDFYTIVAPIDGIVTSLNIAEGDYVRSETSLLTIVNNYDIEFDIEVDELDINDIELGQDVKITIDAIEETEKKPLIGKVSNISIEGNSMNNVTSYPVTITLEGNDQIKMGMNCSAEIIVESRNNVLTLPVEAITTRKNRYYVTLKDGSEKEVEVGLYDEDNIEIISGLTIGEQVLLPTVVKSNTETNTEKSLERNSMGGMMNGNFGGEFNAGMPQGGRNFSGGRPSL